MALSRADFPAIRSALPAQVKNWLIGQYLSDPTPDEMPGPMNAAPEPIVFVRFGDFMDFLNREGISLLPNLDTWRKAGWIHDLYVDIMESDDPGEMLSYAVARLNLPLGRHRLVGIRKTVAASLNQVAPGQDLLEFAIHPMMT